MATTTTTAGVPTEEEVRRIVAELRPVIDAADSPERVEGFTTVLKDGVSKSALTHYRTGGNR